jgi:DnaJ-class molecular chaperone
MTCPYCRGSGWLPAIDEAGCHCCDHCGGLGWLDKTVFDQLWEWWIDLGGEG